MKVHSKFFLKSLQDTNNFAKRISKLICPGMCICIKGKLGIGKTTLVNFILNHYSKKKLVVTSPTFSLVNIYEFDELNIWHYDLFRLKKKSEIYNLDLELAIRDCVIIEWPEIVEDILPKNRINIFLKETTNTNIEVKCIQQKDNQ